MGKLVLILGGARSGKSGMAERLAAQAGPRVTYIATCQPHDQEMAERIATHRAARPESWRTLEEPLELDRAIQESAADSDAVVVDCLTLWLSNHLCRLDLPESGTVSGSSLNGLNSEIQGQLSLLVRTVRSQKTTALLVSNEVGLGLVPATPLGRVYRDLLGFANRFLAAEADQVLMMVAGLPIDVKQLAWRQEG